jgi:hypothetical protein
MRGCFVRDLARRASGLLNHRGNFTQGAIILKWRNYRARTPVKSELISALTGQDAI